MSGLKAGAAQVDITPLQTQFLYGYPHVRRYSTGIHDPLWSSALYMADSVCGSEIMFIANDIIYVDREMTHNIRMRIGKRTGMKPETIMITATHTHSGPRTVVGFFEWDPVVPQPDPEYVGFVEDRVVEAGCLAYERAKPATAGLATADSSGIGTNRRDPAGPADHEVPVLAVKTPDGENIACMLVCSMHPTVLHEDSTLVSGDFPGMARLYLQANCLGKDCPVLHHTGPAGNQSPRHVTRSNTFEEAERLGRILGTAVEGAVKRMEFRNDIKLGAARISLDDLPRQAFPPVAEAESDLERAAGKLALLRESRAPARQTRTAECDWFGAERRVAIARAAASGTLDKAYCSCLPAEVQLLKVGDWHFAGWPGEVFVEYALAVKNRCPNTYVIAYANGHLSGYIVTAAAAAEGGYEASTALFSWETGNVLEEETVALFEQLVK